MSTHGLLGLDEIDSDGVRHMVDISINNGHDGVISF
jgi:hypothetical protein